jgi:NADH-quinone oxidoreductase subunit N
VAPRELTLVMAATGFLIVTYFATVAGPLYNAAHAATGSLF